ncbi:MAG: hypothetical protein LWW96_04800, partial [Acidovorax sp.]|uniref:hypothetical protein n=1 Tax=Acidovorax sp. TaxID=1872122 RepID=UPI0025B985CA
MAGSQGKENEAATMPRGRGSRVTVCGGLPTTTIVPKTGTVSSRLGGFSLNTRGVQFIPSMSRTRKATHRTRFKNGFCTGFSET